MQRQQRERHAGSVVVRSMRVGRTADEQRDDDDHHQQRRQAAQHQPGPRRHRQLMHQPARAIAHTIPQNAEEEHRYEHLRHDDEGPVLRRHHVGKGQPGAGIVMRGNQRLRAVHVADDNIARIHKVPAALNFRLIAVLLRVGQRPLAEGGLLLRALSHLIAAQQLAAQPRQLFFHGYPSCPLHYSTACTARPCGAEGKRRTNAMPKSGLRLTHHALRNSLYSKKAPRTDALLKRRKKERNSPPRLLRKPGSADGEKTASSPCRCVYYTPSFTVCQPVFAF